MLGKTLQHCCIVFAKEISDYAPRFGRVLRAQLGFCQLRIVCQNIGANFGACFAWHLGRRHEKIVLISHTERELREG